MTSDHLIRRLRLVENTPLVIWEQIHRYFGDDYFLEIIEDEYGISQDSTEKLSKQLQQQFSDFEQLSQNKILELKESYQIQIHHLNKDIQNKTEDIGKLNRQVFQVAVKTRTEVENEMDELFKEKEVILFNRYDNEKQELYDKIRDLERVNEDFEKERVRLKELLFF